MMCNFMYDKVLAGTRIQEKRKLLGLTQEKLAEKIEKSLRLIADLERGAVGMSMETLFELCNALKVTPNDLLLPSTDEQPDELSWLLDTLSNSSDHVRAAAIDILKAYLRSV